MDLQILNATKRGRLGEMDGVKLDPAKTCNHLVEANGEEILK